MISKTVFYLKVNTHSEFALCCFNHWVDIVEAYGANLFIVCDDEQLKKTIVNKYGKKYFFICTNPRAQNIVYDLVTSQWLNTSCALFTPFLHAIDNGFDNLFNIDADDTMMLCKAQLCAEALRKAKKIADTSDINCFSLDMHSSAFNRFYYHWSFGVTYIKMDVDYIESLMKIKDQLPKLLNNGLMRLGNFDEIFTNLEHEKLLKLGSFYIDNLHFRHNIESLFYYKNSRWAFKYVSSHARRYWNLSDYDIQDGIPIWNGFVKIDVGIKHDDYVAFTQNNNLYTYFNNSPILSDKRKMSLRDELSKTFILFREDINIPIYLWGGYKHFTAKNNMYRYLVGFDLFEEIYGFIDNDPSMWGTKYNNIDIYSPDVIKRSVLIIISGTTIRQQVERQLIRSGYIHFFNYIYSNELDIMVKKFIYSHTRRYQNIHKGARCFIIGNGPSVTIHDLELLYDKNEITFASNNFHKIFNETLFRPNYYFIADTLTLEGADRILDNPNITVFADFNYRVGHKVNNLDNIYYFEQSMWANYDYPYRSIKPMFSDDIALMFYGGSISYIMLQVAVNMGFTEIYFLGMDHTYPVEITSEGELIINEENRHHFYKHESLKVPFYARQLVESSYSYAREYCKAKGVKIYNATRGGNLETFQRIDFDNLF